MRKEQESLRKILIPKIKRWVVYDKKCKYKNIIKEKRLKNCGNFGFSEGFDAETGRYARLFCPSHCKEGTSSSGSFTSSSSGGKCIPNYRYT